MFRALEAEIRALVRVSVWVLVLLVALVAAGIAIVHPAHRGPAVAPCPPHECPLNSSAP